MAMDTTGVALANIIINQMGAPASAQASLLSVWTPIAKSIVNYIQPAVYDANGNLVYTLTYNATDKSLNFNYVGS